jgi:hypothetical protein
MLVTFRAISDSPPERRRPIDQDDAQGLRGRAQELGRHEAAAQSAANDGDICIKKSWCDSHGEKSRTDPRKPDRKSAVGARSSLARSKDRDIRLPQKLSLKSSLSAESSRG